MIIILLLGHRFSKLFYIRLHPVLCIALSILGSGLHLICGTYSLSKASQHDFSQQVSRGRLLVAASSFVSLMMIVLLDLSKVHEYNCDNPHCEEYLIHKTLPINFMKHIHFLQISTTLIGALICFDLAFVHPNYPISAIKFLALIAVIIIIQVAMNLVDEILENQLEKI